MNERIKELRKILGFSQSEFGEKIGLRKGAISSIEVNRTNVTNQTVLSIINTFEVNEEWLRTGQGKMFSQRSKDEEVVNFFGSNINERLKQLRQALGLTQKDFGKKIGLKPTSISSIENDQASVTESNIRAICREFDISESWLRTGQGEMFSALSRDEEIARFIGKLAGSNDDKVRNLFLHFAKLEPEHWVKIADIIISFGPKHFESLSNFFNVLKDYTENEE